VRVDLLQLGVLIAMCLPQSRQSDEKIIAC
jgi:hypothetical protein